MKYISLDLETTCIDPKHPGNILMISMIVEDSNNPLPLEQLPHFTAFIRQETIEGSAYALAMNHWILDIISGRKENNTKYPIYDGSSWIGPAQEFLSQHFVAGAGKIPVAGKNVATFDIQFMPKGIKDRFSYKVIDPTSMFIDWDADKLPGLETLKKKLGLGDFVAHDAYEDAIDVIRVLRTTYGKTSQR